ncbi:MAG: phosphotransferase [Chloroflexota bacterium]|nr:phosphotransferase [Chloroflexota bacterium]
MDPPADLTDFAGRIRRHFPDLVARSVRALPHPGWGGENDALLVDDALVFRFPRQPEAARALAVEVCLLPELAPLVALPIPRFTHVARDPATGLPLFVGYPLIPGEPLTPDRFAALAGDPATVERLAAGLAAFLTGLHRFPLDRARACGVPAPAGALRKSVAARRDATRARVYPALAPDERAVVEQIFEGWLGDPRHFAWTPALCHGDLTSDHILVAARAERGIAGIIDFGDLTIGDPAGDFVWRFEWGDAFFRRVLARYRAPVGDPAAFARVVACRYRLMPLHQIAHGLATGNAADVEEGRRRLRAGMNGRPVAP